MLAPVVLLTGVICLAEIVFQASYRSMSAPSPSTASTRLCKAFSWSESFCIASACCAYFEFLASVLLFSSAARTCGRCAGRPGIGLGFQHLVLINGSRPCRSDSSSFNLSASCEATICCTFCSARPRQPFSFLASGTQLSQGFSFHFFDLGRFVGLDCLRASATCCSSGSFMAASSRCCLSGNALGSRQHAH